MLRIIIGAVLGFSAGTFAGIRAARTMSTMKVHKDLADKFESDCEEIDWSAPALEDEVEYVSKNAS